jgi:hypothetical protein
MVKNVSADISATSFLATNPLSHSSGAPGGGGLLHLVFFEIQMKAYKKKQT